jgi:predicted permease
MSRLAGLLFRAFVRTLPARLRERHGVEMGQLYAEALERAARRGVHAWCYVAVRGLADVVEQAIRARTATAERRSPTTVGDTMESIRQDLRFAWRSLSKSPGFTVVATLTLALGIGANTSIFTLVNAVLLRAPTHIERPERLVSIYTSDFSGPQYGMSSYPDYRDFRDESPAIADAIALMPFVVNVAGSDGISEIFVTEFVSGNYFEMLGVPLAMGRGFTPEEGDPGSGAAVAVLSHGLWQRRFGADPSIIGRTLRASGQTLTVVGVAPEGFGGMLPLVTPELWIPVSTLTLIQGDGFDRRGSRGWLITARLAEEATPQLAQNQLTALASRLQEEYPDSWTDVNDATRRVSVVSDIRLPPQVKGAVNGFALLLLVVVGIVLLIACANVANLTLARGSRRGREVAVKVVLGAGRVRVVRQLLAESAIIGIAGGVAGAATAAWLLRMAESLRPVAGVTLTLDLGVDRGVLLFSSVVTIATVLAVGLLPALKASRPSLVPSLKEGAGEGSGRFRWYELRHLLVISQVSASLILLVGAGLFLKSVRAAIQVDPGFTVDGVATVTLSLGPEGFSPEESLALFEELGARVARSPDVQATAIADALPMTLTAGRRLGVSVPGYEPAQGEDMEFQFHGVGPGFMSALGMELLTGREFTAADDGDGAPVIMVNETFAERFWPGESPLGKLVNWTGQDDAQVVGLVRDAMYRDLRDEDRPAFFVPVAQRPGTVLTLVARTAPGGAEPFLGTLRQEVAAIDARLPITTLQTMEDAIAFTLLPQRVASWLLSLAGGLGLLLATVGLYGVMSVLVAQRTREVGVRMALGAEARDVIRMVVGRGVGLAAAGAIVGLGLAALVTRFAQSLLFGVSPLDLGVFGLMAVSALGVAGFASWVPARRASGIDPIEALRHE